MCMSLEKNLGGTKLMIPVSERCDSCDIFLPIDHFMPQLVQNSISAHLNFTPFLKQSLLIKLSTSSWILCLDNLSSQYLSVASCKDLHSCY